MVFKTQVIYQGPWNLTTAVNFQSQSGRLIITEIRVPSSVTQIPGATRIPATAINGIDRTKQWTTLDLRVEKAFPLGGSMNAAVFGDFLNLFNSDAYENVLDRLMTSSNYLVLLRVDCCAD